MNRKRMSVVVTLSIALATSLSIISAPLTSAATKPKAAGRTSTTIPNTILNGKGAPLSKIGIDGDFYIDTRSLLIYGPKKTGKWPLPQNLQGPIGANGVDGKNGSEGKTIATASNVAGPVGAQGLQGEKGEKGEKGEAGAPGSSGSAGPAGATGATGPQGPSGGGGGGSPGPTGATGATGATGLTGLTGAKGETGTAGADGANGTVGLKGETGTAGATGPSNVYVNALPTWTLSTGTARTSSTSSLLPKFKAGKSYIYTIHLTGLTNSSTAIFEIDIIHEDSSASRFNYIPSKQDNFLSEPIFFRHSFVITGVITTTSADVGISIKVTDDKGSTGTNPLSLSGYMYSTLVGSIGAL